MIYHSTSQSGRPNLFKQILQGFVALILLIGLVWLTFYALIIVLILAVIGVSVFAVRRFLIKQGIITPRTPDRWSPDETQAGDDYAGGQVIDSQDYTDVTQKTKNDDN